MSKKAGESAGGRDGGIGCGGYFPGDGLAYEGKGKDADDAEGAKDRDDVRKRDTFGHGNVGDGDVEGYAWWSRRGVQRKPRQSGDWRSREEDGAVFRG